MGRLITGIIFTWFLFSKGCLPVSSTADNSDYWQQVVAQFFQVNDSFVNDPLSFFGQAIAIVFFWFLIDWAFFRRRKRADTDNP